MPARHATIARKLVLLGIAGLAAGQAGCFKLPKFFQRGESPVVRAADRGDHDMSPSKLNGDLDAAKAVLRISVNAGPRWEVMEDAVCVPAKSLMRMLGAGGNPRASNLLELLARLQALEGIRFRVEPIRPNSR